VEEAINVAKIEAIEKRLDELQAQVDKVKEAFHDHLKRLTLEPNLKVDHLAYFEEETMSKETGDK
jgi:hypothetical protein